MTKLQINATRTFGIEIEMNGITRQSAARLVQTVINPQAKAKDTSSINGYRAWSAFDTKGREWKFVYDSSIIAVIDTEKCEMVTPILTLEDLPLLEWIIQALKGVGAYSGADAGCGVHIHLGAKHYNPLTLRNLVNIMAAHEDQLFKAVEVGFERRWRYCKSVEETFLKEINKKKYLTREFFEDTWYELNDDCPFTGNRLNHYNASRYHALNLHSYFHGHGTVEFRLFQFNYGLNYGDLHAMLMMVLAIDNLACSVKRASSKPQQTENEAYAFRCWLLRLGFIGDEFKEVRRFWMKNMKGNCAWRKAA